MSVESIRDAALGVFRTAWANQTPVSWQNVEFTEPNNDLPWIRVGMVHALGSQETLGGVGGKTFRHRGTFYTQVHAPLGRGTELTDALCQSILDILEGTTLGQVVLNNCRINEVGLSGAWYQTDVLADFFYDVIR